MKKPFIQKIGFLCLILFIVFSAACGQKQAAPQTAPQDEVLLAGTGTPATNTASPSNFSLDDYDDDPEAEISDPLEPWNRFWFHVNDFLLLQIIKPAHNAYVAVTAEEIRGGISNFSSNILAPVRFANFILQGEFGQAGVEMGRFLINSMTSLGLADVASQNKYLYAYHPENGRLGYTLNVWGIPRGPYFVLPLYGPSTIREGIGKLGDSFLKPENYMLDWDVTVPVNSVLSFNDMGATIKVYEQLTSSAFEPYVALRNAYLSSLQNNEPAFSGGTFSHVRGMFNFDFDNWHWPSFTD